MPLDVDRPDPAPFQFEGSLHETLDCVPLVTRRKLDLVGLKISLDGWRALPFQERRLLCAWPAETDEEIASFRATLIGLAADRGVPLAPITADPRTWRGPEVPAVLASRVPGEAWRRLDDLSRYALVKTADPRRNPERLRALLAELGLGPPGEPSTETDSGCGPSTKP